jgi:phosphoketolase
MIKKISQTLVRKMEEYWCAVNSLIVGRKYLRESADLRLIFWMSALRDRKINRQKMSKTIRLSANGRERNGCTELK